MGGTGGAELGVRRRRAADGSSEIAGADGRLRDFVGPGLRPGRATPPFQTHPLSTLTPHNAGSMPNMFKQAAICIAQRLKHAHATGTSCAIGALFLLGTGRPFSPPARLTPIPCLGVHSPKLLSA